MKAIVIHQYGGPDVLAYEDVPDPVAKPGEVVVAIHAASVNRADHSLREGRNPYPISLPYIPGRDFAGVVKSIAGDGAGLAVGDRVYGVCPMGRDGAYAEQIAIAAVIVARLPAALGFADAAGVALTGLTALVSIEDCLKIRAGETVLVQGGAGGVGGFASQFAKLAGARVLATASAANRDYVASLGADRVINYAQEDFLAAAAGCDAVLDTVGGETAMKSFAALKPGGRAAFIGSGAQAPQPNRPDVTALRPQVGRSRAALERVAALIVAGQLRLPAIETVPLAEAARAHQMGASRHGRGKIVLVAS